MPTPRMRWSHARCCSGATRVVMYQDGIRYLEKAPLHYWMVAVGYRLFRQGAFSPGCRWCLSVVGLVLMVYFLPGAGLGRRQRFIPG